MFVAHAAALALLAAMLLWGLACYPIFLEIRTHFFSYTQIIVLLFSAYALQWVAGLAELWWLNLWMRPKRSIAYCLLFVASSFLLVAETAKSLQVSFYSVLVVLWAVGPVLYFIPIFFMTMWSDLDLSFDVRITPFIFSVLGAIAHLFWAASI